MAANNETGVLQPLDDIAEIAAEAGILLLSDMVQFFGKHSMIFLHQALDMPVCRSKIGGPAGVGALLVASVRCQACSRWWSRTGRRSGTRKFIGIAGFGAAASASGDSAHYADWRTGAMRWARDFRATVGANLWQSSAATWEYSCIAAGPKTAETMVMAFDIAGIAVSAGAACSSGKVQSSHVQGMAQMTRRRVPSVCLAAGQQNRLILKQLQMCLCVYASKSVEPWRQPYFCWRENC